MDVPLLEVETAILGQTAPLTQTSAVDESHVLAANALLRNVRSSADMPTAAGGHECTARSPEGLGHRETGIDRSQRAILTTIQHERAGGELPVEPLALRSVLNSSIGMRVQFAVPGSLHGCATYPGFVLPHVANLSPVHKALASTAVAVTHSCTPSTPSDQPDNQGNATGLSRECPSSPVLGSSLLLTSPHSGLGPDEESFSWHPKTRTLDSTGAARLTPDFTRTTGIRLVSIGSLNRTNDKTESHQAPRNSLDGKEYVSNKASVSWLTGGSIKFSYELPNLTAHSHPMLRPMPCCWTLPPRDWNHLEYSKQAVTRR